MEEKGKRQTIPIHATSDAGSIGKADLVIFFVKTYHTEKAVSNALMLPKRRHGLSHPPEWSWK
jgi:ketopantoate reductase